MWYRMNDLKPLGMYLSIAVDLYDAAQGDMLTLPSSSTNGTIEGRNIWASVAILCRTRSCGQQREFPPTR
jgi:hypothetical protein